MRKMRFAVAFFNEPGLLAQAAVALAERGARRERLHAVGNDDTLAAASRLLALQGHPHRLTDLARCMTCGADESGHPWVLELVAASLDGDGAQRSRQSGGCRGLAEKAGPDLERHWRSGGSVLIVQLEDGANEQDVCGLLLRHRSSSVQTHDLRTLD